MSQLFQDIADCRNLLIALGAKVIHAHSEGEGTCALLNRFGIVHGVMAEDSDVMAFGGVRLIRGVGCIGTREDSMMEYDIPKILNALDLTPEQVKPVFTCSNSHSVCRSCYFMWM